MDVPLRQIRPQRRFAFQFRMRGRFGLFAAIIGANCLVAAANAPQGPEYGPWGFDLTAVDSTERAISGCSWGGLRHGAAKPERTSFASKW
jgi:hypothetical protein